MKKQNLVTLGHAVHWASIIAGLLAGVQTGSLPVAVVSIAQVIHKILDTVDTSMQSSIPKDNVVSVK